MEFAHLTRRALAIRSRYSALERARFGREWSNEKLLLGFVTDVGDLARLVQAKEGVREVPGADEALAHELADCLWSVIVLADRYGVDLERAFLRTMDELDTTLS